MRKSNGPRTDPCGKSHEHFYNRSYDRDILFPVAKISSELSQEVSQLSPHPAQQFLTD